MSGQGRSGAHLLGRRYKACSTATKCVAAAHVDENVGTVLERKRKYLAGFNREENVAGSNLFSRYAGCSNATEFVAPTL